MKPKQLLLTCLLAMFVSIQAHAGDYDFVRNNIYYVVTSATDKTVEVTQSDTYSGDIYIPSTVTYMGQTYTVTSIGDHAFSGCSSLSSVTIPNSVTNISFGAFYGCSGLTSVTIPGSVTSIGDYAFSNCSGLTSIKVEGGNSKYDSRNNCNAIIEKATNTLVAGCQNTVIPNGVTSIGDGAFTGCSSLTSITIPNSVTSIGDYAFEYCNGLTSVTIGNNVISIGYRAFESCTSLTSITIPNSVTSIDNFAFYGCTGLTSITISKSVTSIGDYAFMCCTSLTSITIPNSVTSIGDYAFSYCSGLTSVTIPNSVTSIGDYAFSYCSGLTSVTIGNSVTSIDFYAFTGCSNLTDVYCYAENVPNTNNRAFEDCPCSAATLHVPTASLIAYRTTYPWRYFGNIVAIERTIENLSELSNNKQYLIHTRDKIRGSLGVINNHLASNNPTVTGPYDCRPVVLDTDNPLITSVNQLSSPNTEPTEGSLADMIDGNSNTYWHSTWSDGDVENGTHYFQVEMVSQDDIDVAFQVTRRKTNDNHITEWGVYGTNNANASKTNCTLLAVIETPYNNWGETRVSDIFNTGGFKYLRFYINDTSTPHGYGHLAEFQLYPATFDETRDASPFAIIQKNDGYYLYSVLDKAFITPANNGNESVHPLLPSDNKMNIYKRDNHFVFDFVETGYTINVNFDPGISISKYGTLTNKFDDGNLFTIEEVGDFDPTEALAKFATQTQTFTVTYEVMFDGYVVATATEEVANGSALPPVPASLSNKFITLTKTGTHPTTVTEDVTVTYNAMWKGPFEFTKTEESAMWYNLKIRGVWYVSKQDTEPYKPEYSINEDKRAMPAYQWAFGGDPYHVKVYNRTTGLNETLTKDGDMAVMRSGDYTWDLLPNNDGFMLRVTGTDYSCINQYGGTNGPLQIWTNIESLTDDGSTFRVGDVIEETGPFGFSNKKLYTLTCKRGGMALNANATGLAAGQIRTDETEADKRFAIITYEGAQYFYSPVNKQYLLYNGSFVSHLGSPISFDDTHADGIYKFMISTQSENGERLYFNNDNGFTESGFVIDNYDTPDDGNRWLIEPVADFDPTEALALAAAQTFTVTYNVTFDGKVVATATEEVASGSALPSAPASLSNKFITLTKTGIHPTTVTEDIAVTYNATWKGPFEFTKTEESAKWYNLKIRGVWYVSKQDTEPYKPEYSINEDKRAMPAYQWAFGGDPYQVKIYNRTTGLNETLTKDGDMAVMRSGDYTWDLLPNNDGFVLRVTGTDYSCINQYCGINGPLQIWTNIESLTDDGSTFRVAEVPSPAIRFADAKVKAICVANWDTDGDGELSEAEAAAVTNLGKVFKDKDISQFNELQYFTGLTSIGADAFSSSHLASIIIPNSVTSIGNSAFSLCHFLTSITIPNSVTSIGNSTFYECTGLTSITIPNSVKNIGNSAFSDCSSLTSFNIPNSVTSIGDYAFIRCHSLKSVTIGNGMTSIGHSVFYGCSSLTSITIPNSVTSIGESAFGECTSLTSITIPNSVTSIGERAFQDCSGLTSITIPNSVTSIGNNAFTRCGSLTDVYCYAKTVPSTGDLAFANSNFAHATLHVPAVSYKAYSTTVPWSSFGTIEPINGYVISDETTSFSIVAKESGKAVVFIHQFTGDWEALYLPFAIDYDAIRADFDLAEIDGVVQNDDNNDGIADITVLSILGFKEQMTEPNTPYLIRAKNAGEQTIVFDDVTVYPTEAATFECSSFSKRYEFTGSYNTLGASALANRYVVQGGELVKGASSLAPCRWYMTAISKTGGALNLPARIRIMPVEDVITGSPLLTSPEEEGLIYNVSGQRLNKIQKGINIKDGKKVLIK